MVRMLVCACIYALSRDKLLHFKNTIIITIKHSALPAVYAELNIYHFYSAKEIATLAFTAPTSTFVERIEQL